MCLLGQEFMRLSDRDDFDAATGQRHQQQTLKWLQVCGCVVSFPRLGRCVWSAWQRDSRCPACCHVALRRHSPALATHCSAVRFAVSVRAPLCRPGCAIWRRASSAAARAARARQRARGTTCACTCCSSRRPSAAACSPPPLRLDPLFGFLLLLFVFLASTVPLV